MKSMLFICFVAMMMVSCGPQSSEQTEADASNIEFKVQLMTLDPGHFHAALVQKTMYDQVSPEVHVFAPEGEDVKLHQARIEGFNNRAENPTNWQQNVYTGADFFERMIAEKPGNVMVIAGNNAKKTEYILQAIQNGINVLADKPMVITTDRFPMLIQAFEVAQKKGLLLYDIMTERYEVTTMLQKRLSQIPEIFGALEMGSVDNPAITKESIHHFAKNVSGKPLIRPPWFFDVEQEGDGIVDVSTHLVDLVQWECFPDEILDFQQDIEMLKARRWATVMDPEMFEQVTGLSEYPHYLQKDIKEGNLHVYSNGAFTYKLKGVHAKVSVIWNFRAPEGTGDTHYSIMRGSKANLIIQQGEEEGYKATLYVEQVADGDLSPLIAQTIEDVLQKEYPGISFEKINDTNWKIVIPDKYKVGHEAHFGQVTQKYLQYLEAGKLPDWEIPNMIAKYYTTTEAFKMALKNSE